MSTRRGRPPLDWRGWDALEVGRAYIIEAHIHGHRLTGRIVRTEDDSTVVVVDADRIEHTLTREQFIRCREVPGLFSVGALVARIGVPTASWRGSVRGYGRVGVDVDTAAGVERYAEDELISADAALRREANASA